MIIERAALVKALEGSDGVRPVVVDCGRGAENAVIRDGTLLFAGLSLSRETIEKLKEDVCYLVSPEGLKEVAFFGDDTGKYYKLHATGAWPTVEISSTPMHRHSEITPEEDTRWKVQCISPVRGIVLDTCCGLGYTAIMTARSAEIVHTFEVDQNMVRMMRYNPWSRELFERMVETGSATVLTGERSSVVRERVREGVAPLGEGARTSARGSIKASRTVTAGDAPARRSLDTEDIEVRSPRLGHPPAGSAAEYSVSLAKVAAVASAVMHEKNIILHEQDVREGICDFSDDTFDRIIHDPPTFKYAGELYSLVFYRELRRVLKRNGILYHYTPSPGKQKGRDFVGGVLSRLKQAGFTTRYVKDASGIVARPA